MPNRPLTAKEASAIEFYCDTTSETFNRWGRSCLKAGYSKCKGWEQNASRVLNKDAVQAGIGAYKAKVTARTGRTVQSVDAMQQAAYDLAMSQKQPAAASTAATAIARLYAMDKDNQANPDKPQSLTPEQHQEALNASNRQLDVKLSREGA